MRVEGQHRASQVRPTRPLADAAQNRLMAQMYAIEISDRHHGAFSILAEVGDPLFGRMHDGKRHRSATSTPKLSPSYASRTFFGSFALASAWPRSWQMCVNQARFGFNSATSASDCSTFECVGCGTYRSASRMKSSSPRSRAFELSGTLLKS